MDYKDSLGIVYHLYSMKYNHKIVIKVKLDRQHPVIQSVERVWKTANWHEREAYDMFGVYFEEHPDLERILCPEDWEGYPPRKDYVAPKEYRGIDATPNVP
ncbi:NAD(P)H-quinone oxidoreductase subunit J [bioreactor metagenome]|uniref:NAD(P)H-quinone oxidoreductase subunit J n=1 Tax=bioreactor metagenome TaxID=1076179 RepID=A0A645FE23_9ZZZZ